MIWLLLLILAVVLAILVTPFAVEHYRTPMSDGRRGSAPGQFVELSQGVTHYHISGPAEAPLIVCVHGLTTPGFVWGPLTKGLVAAGYRVLVYDLYGRGYSDRPEGLQDKQFFNTQLDDLLTHLDIDAPLHLIGYSMGGAIAAGFAMAHPGRVQNIVLIAPAGLHLIRTPMIEFIRHRGILGRWLLLAAYPAQLRRGIRAERDKGADAAITEAQKAQLDFRGFVPAILSSLRGILGRTMEGEHLALRQSGLPVLAIWAQEDDVIPPAAMGQLAAWNRDALHEVIEGAGHGVPYTHTDVALAHILAFLPPPETALPENET